MNTHPAPQGAIARLSLEHKLPMLMGGLLLLVIVALATAAYVHVRGTAIRTANERVSTVALQFRDIFQQSTAQMRALIRESASSPALAGYVRTRTPAMRRDALAALQYTGPAPEQVIGTELRDVDGKVLLSTAPAAFRFDTIPLTESRQVAGRDSAFVGRFRVVASMPDTLVFPVVAQLPAGNGYLVRWRRQTGSRRSRELISRLVGSGASVFLGSPAGDVWTDMERSTAPPPASPDSTAAPQRYQRPDGTRQLAASALVPGTAWMAVVEVPMAAVEAPVRQFLRRIALLAALALAIGLAAAWITSRRITRPLLQLADAASAISAGEIPTRVEIQRSDELGQLGTAFATMADEVRQTRANLEQRIEERTRDLHATLGQLHDAQDALVRRERLAMLGQLSSGVGHELRNPLGVMTNAVYYLKAVLASAPANVHEYLDILQQQITLSEKIVGDLLDFARQKPPQRKPTPLREATDTQVQKLGRTDGVRIEVDVPDDVPPVLVDPIQLGQIILNLLTNASQAMNGAGRITVRASENGSSVQYEVSDTGSGIPAENLERVFEPLYTTKARGIGLGLSVSRMLARANGGELSASSPPGSGATFRLTLQKASRESL